MSDRIKNLGDKRQIGATETNAGRWPKGVSANPGGKPSLRRDLERAGTLNPDLAGLTPEQARAKWWAMILPVAFAGPQGPKDANWSYASREVGERLLGKAKEHVVLEQTGDGTRVDWSKTPADERKQILDAIHKLELITAEPLVDGDGNPIEH